MKLLDLLDQLENELESASNVLLTNKVMVNKDSMLDLLDEIRSAVPADIKEAKKILDDSTKIKQAAQRDANNMMKEAKAQKEYLVDTNNITKHAYEEAETILKDAKNEANKLRARSIEYVMNLLTKTQDDMRQIIVTIDDNKSELKDKRKAVSNVGDAR
jgi:hypothetical protein